MSFKGLLTGLIRLITHLPETLFVLVISTITTFFMLVRRERMYLRFLRILPPGWGLKMQVVIRDVSRAFVGTVRVQIVLMLFSCVMGIIGMSVIGVPYAFLLGVLFGVAGLVPMLGSALLTVPWAAGAFMLGDVRLAIKLLLVQLVISIIRHLIEPKILADNVGLDMLSTLFGLYVGLQVMGFIGLFLGPIVMIAVKSLLRAHMFRDFFPEKELEAYDPDS
jgi:sporulation integral membrane protein YtvI